ncbi:MAG: TIGR00730 family Rossman fold protein [Muribaculaceae bacterium]|nr:TIGR00730 family Rossman fold protein [Muribaculaceae bacterium]
MKIVVYCSANNKLPQEVLDIAVALGRWIGENGHTLVYGGVNAGLMHVSAMAAHETGCESIVGIVPEFFKHRADPLCTELVLARDLNHRKAMLVERGDVFVVLPGGLGTIDEWVSTLSTLVVEDSDRPIIVVNHDNMYSSLAQQLDNTAQSQFSRSPRIASSILVNNAQELINKLNQVDIGCS